MAYKNPIPSIDDVRVARKFIIVPTFVFDEEISLKEAAEGIEHMIRDNGGKIPLDWLQFAEKPQIKQIGT